ncbi:hypothetical protein T492DRAFT_1138625 [Pavlovales sp. CCMP2436]|nr:hypothetical protein T492DRAFT_1138625 [Pavlovales sp. CCMP2436]
MLNKTKMICAQYWGCQSSLNNLNNLLFAFQIFFGLFLTFTVTWNRNLHTAFVALFALAAIWHFVLIAFFDRAPFFEMAVLTMAIGGFLGVGGVRVALIVMVAAITFAPGLDIPPFLFWAIECIALTGMVLFTPVRTGISNSRLAQFRFQFDQFPKDRSDCIDKTELRHLLEGNSIDMDARASKAALNKLDANCSVSITFPEFLEL